MLKLIKGWFFNSFFLSLFFNKVLCIKKSVWSKKVYIIKNVYYYICSKKDIYMYNSKKEKKKIIYVDKCIGIL